MYEVGCKKFYLIPLTSNLKSFCLFKKILKFMEDKNMSKKIMILVILIFIGTVLTTTGVYAANEVVSNSNSNTTQQTTQSSNGVGLIAAALAIGLSAIGSGVAVAVVASSAVGAISENPSLLGKTVIFAGLAEGIAIYGLIIAIMIISKV